MRLPGILDLFVDHKAATYPLHVIGAGPDDDNTMTFDPRDFMEGEVPPLKRPMCLPIIASNVLAATLLKRSNGRVDGFIIEGPTAGGHNAPPRGKLQLNDQGEPIYGERDVVDLAKMRELGLPFWLAGGYGSSDMVRAALADGAAGVQVGTAFAFCEESGLRGDYKESLIDKAVRGDLHIKTDPLASPTGFPFKVAQLEGTLSADETYGHRARICDLGYLREAYKTPEGEVGYRCAGEPITLYVDKGGSAAEAAGRKCLCNALMANIGLAQVRAGKHLERGLITAGDDVAGGLRFLPAGGPEMYSAADVVAKLLPA